MSSRGSLALLVSALTMGGACAPDVHIHIHNYYSGTETDDGMETAADTEGEAGMGTPTSGSSPPGDDGTPPATTGSPTGPADADTGDTNGGVDAYPAPDGGSCAAPAVYSQPADGFEFCTPACDGGSCPAPATGNATPFCAFNPDSTNTPCVEGDMTCTGEEVCGPVPGGTFGCALPPSHCALLCSMGEQCPDGMQCAPVGACMFPL